MAHDRKDYHSYSNPEKVRVRHAKLDLDVLFPQKILKGTVTLTVDRIDPTKEGPVILDTRNLVIENAESSSDAVTFAKTSFKLGNSDPILGAPLTVDLPLNANSVRITYSTRPEASGLQWMEPAQTAGKKFPFLYSQSQAIHARSWIPLQDTPGVRLTYSARIRTPKELRAVMSAVNDLDSDRRSEYTFEMARPIPSYLIALAVGDLEFRAMSKRTGVYAEPSVVEKAAKEFSDTERMIGVTEDLYGPYKWGRYDILVLPPSFPFGGMENPRLTFATPTVISGDKSLVSLVAHELAHSWSGNLVTNATWRDFWLNEGFTVYIEERIQELVFGGARSEMEAVLARQELDQEMAHLPPKDQILHIDLQGRDPDDAMTQVPYVKGMLFLKQLENVFGRDRFDPFLRSYFEQYGFRSVITADFLDYLKKNLLDTNPDLAARINVEEWVNQPGIPASAPRAKSDAFEKIDNQVKDWLGGRLRLEQLPVKSWSTQEWLHFLRAIPQDSDKKRMVEMENTFHLSRSSNSEILAQWL
ncbi:MAG TPA: M1 family aminopeptidase, partial [Bryobacteraceae bacterium]|nr:M1 family aminopeptidase [Bryobacteraceae bacterium]